mgnify:CR=1 FL=1
MNEMMTEAQGGGLPSCFSKFSKQQQELALPMAQPYSIPLYPLEKKRKCKSYYHGANLKALSPQQKPPAIQETNLPRAY